MSFFLVRLEPGVDGKMVDVPIPDFGPYEKGPEAAKFAKQLSEQLGFKVQPRRSSQAPDWRARQAQRLEDGTLTRLPAKWDVAPITDHFAHLEPAKHPGMICFTENEDLGIIDRFTVLTPGRYLARYYGAMSDSEQRRLIAAVDPSGQLFLAWTPEEIVRVYKEGPSSCMDGIHNFDKLPVHPTYVYGAGDLAIAYTMNAQNRIQSRAMVWPEKKLFGRVYGDVERMTALLLDEGYDSDRDCNSADGNGGHFNGVKLLKVLFENSTKAVMPYLDDIALSVDAGDHWISVETTPARSDTDHPDVCHSGGTSGYALIKQWCPKLLEYYDKDKFRYVRGVDQHWCLFAVSSYAFTCSQTNEIWPNEKKVQLRGGQLVCEEWFAEHGAVCEGSDEKCRARDLIEHEGKRVHPGWLREQTIQPLRFVDPDADNPFERNRYDRRFYESNFSAWVADHGREYRREPTMNDMIRMDRERQYYERELRYATLDRVIGIDPAAVMVTNTVNVNVNNERMYPEAESQLIAELQNQTEQWVTDTVMNLDGSIVRGRRRVA
jgi:hypothetical protein